MTKDNRRSVKPPAVRHEEIVRAARALFAEQGVRATTFQQVADRVGVTRGLVYHYVGDMDTLVEQVVDASIADFAADVRRWDAARRPGDIDGAVLGAIALVRRHVRPEGTPAAPRFDDVATSQQYLDRAIEAVVDTLEETTIPAYAARHAIEIAHVRETFVVLVHGLVALVRSQPGTPDDVLATIVRQTLRLATPDPAAG
ncbi:TetR/AcrR family transcriptional regulator [Cellulomonas sp. KH9]|uniref:TetR/AcrR family transcriptional regulator n=1 Tax=Cellulomonas sp. KH9 TaxID=1855324 RepID=UPI0008E64DB7|nr:TetR/AcrR family transcriptional regulator [Cellulomonas sp. KH9]SFK27926.1 transcriptional regulator, TetR family [Cellulomonas sp. KH9]